MPEEPTPKTPAEQTPPEVAQPVCENWYAPLTRVTPLSRVLAAVLFVVLPFLGFWLGTQNTLIPCANNQDVATEVDVQRAQSVQNPVSESNIADRASTDARGTIVFSEFEFDFSSLDRDVSFVGTVLSPPRCIADFGPRSCGMIVGGKQIFWGESERDHLSGTIDMSLTYGDLAEAYVLSVDMQSATIDGKYEYYVRRFERGSSTGGTLPTGENVSTSPVTGDAQTTHAVTRESLFRTGSCSNDIWSLEWQDIHGLWGGMDIAICGDVVHLLRVLEPGEDVAHDYEGRISDVLESTLYERIDAVIHTGVQSIGSAKPLIPDQSMVYVSITFNSSTYQYEFDYNNMTPELKSLHSILQDVRRVIEVEDNLIVYE